MPPTPAEFKIRFPEFAGVADARIQFFIDDAVAYINVARAGSFYTLIISLLVAHYLALAAQSEGGITIGQGAVSSMSVGDKSISFTVPAPVNDSQFYYSQTAYGLRLLTFRSYLTGGGTVV